MRVRRVVVEVEVPWTFSADEVLECVQQGFVEIGYVAGGDAVPHQEQVVADEESTNTRVGDVS